MLVQEAQDPGVHALAQAITSNEMEGTLASTVAVSPAPGMSYVDAAKALLDHDVNLVGVVRDGSVIASLVGQSMTGGDRLVYISKSQIGWPEIGRCWQRPRGPMLADTPESTHIATVAPQLGDVDDATRRALSAALERACSDFDLYRTRFREAGLTEEDIRNPKPFDVLRRLPRLDASDLPTLFRQSLAVNREIIDLEASSGTTGVRKRRPITYDDAKLETRLLARAFDICGVTPEDRVACLDTGPLTLMASFTEGLDQLGAAEAYAFTVSPNSEATVERSGGAGPHCCHDHPVGAGARTRSPAAAAGEWAHGAESGSLRRGTPRGGHPRRAGGHGRRGLLVLWLVRGPPRWESSAAPTAGSTSSPTPQSSSAPPGPKGSPLRSW